MGKVVDLAKAVQRRVDGLKNALTGIGEAMFDKAASINRHRTPQHSPLYYEDLYQDDALARRIVDIPAEEMVRRGFEIKSGETELDVTAIMRAWNAVPVHSLLPEQGLDVAFAHATALAHATGGAAIVLDADDGTIDTAFPLNENSIRALRWVQVLSRDALFPRSWYPKGSDKYGQVETWQVQWPTTGGGQALPSAIVHETRIVLFDGEWVTDRRRAEQQGWGQSVFVALEEELNRHGLSWAAVSTMLQDGSQGVLKIEDLHGMVIGNDEGDAAIRKRIRLIDYSRSVARAIALDAKTEDFKYVDRTFAGIPDALYALMFWLSALTGIPVTMLFGRSPAGLNATGDSDIRIFYDRIGRKQVVYAKPRQQRMLRVLCLSKEGPTQGRLPKDLDIEHCPLWEMSDTEKAQLRKTVADTDALYIQNQVLMPEEVAVSRFGGGDYTTETTIDESVREPGETGDGSGDGTGVGVGAGNTADVQKTVLNGAQVTSLVDVVKAVAASDLPRDSGIAIIKLSFGLDNTQAAEVMGAAGEGFKVEKPQPPTPGVPPPAPPKPGAADVKSGEQGQGNPNGTA